MAITSKVRQQLIDVLTPFFGEEAKRRLILNDVFHGKALLNDINWTGSASDFTGRLVTRLIRYGEIEQGHHTLAALLATLLATNDDGSGKYIGYGEQRDRMEALYSQIVDGVLALDSMDSNSEVSVLTDVSVNTGDSPDNVLQQIPGSQIFVCYSSKNRNRNQSDDVSRIVSAVRQVYGPGEVWMDEDLHGGQKWWDKIVEHIQQCSVFMYMVSEDSLTSPYCQAEFEYAQTLNKRILPILIEKNVTLPDSLQAYHYIQYSRRHRNDIHLEILKAVRNLQPETEQNLSDLPSPPPVPETSGNSEILEASKKHQGRSSWSLSLYLESIRATLSRVTFPASSFKELSALLSTRRSVFVGGFMVILVGAYVLVSQLASPVPAVQEFNGVEMVRVPAGCFEMGAVDSGITYCFENAFWIDRYEVTNAQFNRLDGWAESRSSSDDGDRPRDQITWDEAQAFCIIRGGNLPTEAAWEYAARGPSSLVYPWGNTWQPDNAAVDQREASVVGRYPAGASWVGALDMIGNLAEWTTSIYDPGRFPYPYGSDDGRDTMTDGDLAHVLRGGSFRVPANSYDRARSTDASDTTGFRCVRPD